MTDINQFANALCDFLEYQKEEGVQTLEVSAATLAKLCPAPPKQAAKTTVRTVRPVTPRAAAPRPVAAPRPAPRPAAPPPPPAPPEPAPVTFKTLKEISTAVNTCTQCPLHASRNKAVPGEGNPDHPDILFISEAPGAEEDAIGRPFVGKAGDLMTKMIGAMGYTRDQIYIANIVKCRPPGNRIPLPEEMTACAGYLRAQVELLQPKIIVALGKMAVEGLLNKKVAITRFRGTWCTYQGIDVMPTLHPAYLLRSPGKKREAWDDLQAVMAKLGKKKPAPKG